MNLLLQTDSYKLSHQVLYKPNLEYMYSHFLPRGGDFDEIPFFGLQYYIKKYLAGQVITPAKIEEYEDISKKHVGFYNQIWQKLYKKHGGYLPILIKAVPEGTVVGKKNVVMTVENTDPEFAFLTSYLETLLVKLWYPCTVAAQSRYIRGLINEYIEESGDATDQEFRVHDFGYRGVSSEETAGLGSAANLLSFSGTDTIAGILLLRDYYNSDVFAKSVPATEHSVATLWADDEIGYLKHCLDSFPKGVISVVCDSNNQFKFIQQVIPEFKEKILSRDGCLVIRLDSGVPTESVVRAMDILLNIFKEESNINSKEYLVLPPQVRILQGDGISRFTISTICDALTMRGFSVDNIYFGSGGKLLQDLTRDTCQFAYKASNATVNGISLDISKNPFGDPTKKSHKGRVKLINNGSYKTITNYDPDFVDSEDVLRPVFLDGELLIDDSFSTIKDRAK